MHLEFIRTKEGAMNCSGLQLVRYHSDERLNEIMQIHREHGVYIANPHVYIVEDGKQGQVNPDVVATKMRFDPHGPAQPGQAARLGTARADHGRRGGRQGVSGDASAVLNPAGCAAP